MVEACNLLIRQVKDEISVLSKDCTSLDAAKTKVNQIDNLAAASAEMMRSVENACAVSTGLRIMDQFHAEMIEVISGSSLVDAVDSLGKLIQDIQNEIDERTSRIERLKEKLGGLLKDLESLLAGGDA